MAAGRHPHCKRSCCGALMKSLPWNRQPCVVSAQSPAVFGFKKKKELHEGKLKKKNRMCNEQQWADYWLKIHLEAHFSSVQIPQHGSSRCCQCVEMVPWQAACRRAHPVQTPSFGYRTQDASIVFSLTHTHTQLGGSAASWECYLAAFCPSSGTTEIPQIATNKGVSGPGELNKSQPLRKKAHTHREAIYKL